MPDGSKSVVVQGLHRARFCDMVKEEPYLVARVEMLAEPSAQLEDVEINALVANVRTQLKKLEGLLPDFNPEQLNLIMNTQDVGHFAFLIAALLNLPVPEKQELLETLEMKALLNRLVVSLSKVIQRQELSQKIQADVQESINKAQREYFLREQLRAIKKELGEERDQLEVDEMRKKISETPMPDEIRAVIEKELNRLGVMSPAAAEYSVTRNYVDWLLDMPWMVSTDDNLDIGHVREKLDEDHYGLETVKKRILEYLAVRKLKKDMRGPILCFVGPPGVGKTSLGRSIADALGRKYVRFSLGGVRDEAEIRGHRRTYVGALPGRIIQGLVQAGSSNPVFMLDEVDKLGADVRGDPSSALLEVLDPEQNDSFRDHYLGVVYDLSRVLFIATGNLTETIQPAFLDRMEVIRLSGYTEEEKLEIARRHLLPRQIEETGLAGRGLDFTGAAVRRLITGYTSESGPRNLEREIGSVCRKVAVQVAEGRRPARRITPSTVERLLGPPRFLDERPLSADRIGVATGLAFTAVGGDILLVEAVPLTGKGGLELTGSLGEVMKESAAAALSLAKAQAGPLGIADDWFAGHSLHVHVPAGGIPKDGPSAGVTLLAAMVSAASGRAVRHDLAMTGEITLRGDVLPVGGVKEKVLAAIRAGIPEVLLPAANERDLVDIPKSARRKLKFRFVTTVDEVLEAALASHR
jgi:ATP-dependent Lon protease